MSHFENLDPYSIEKLNKDFSKDCIVYVPFDLFDHFKRRVWEWTERDDDSKYIADFSKRTMYFGFRQRHLADNFKIFLMDLCKEMVDEYLGKT